MAGCFIMIILPIIVFTRISAAPDLAPTAPIKRRSGDKKILSPPPPPPQISATALI